MALKDVIGQKKAVNILFRTIQRDRIPSSYLFAGEPGIGKKFAAINLAKAVNCTKIVNSHQSSFIGHKNNKEEPERLLTVDYRLTDCCDVCSSCRKIDAGIHPDFSLILPESGQIRIEEIRAINEILFLKPFEGRKKIVIVDDAELMNQNAANAFLKTLEEPPEDSLIIIISSNPDRLPDTIRSRCARINFTPLPGEECEKVIERSPGHQPSVISRKTNIKKPETDDSILSTLARLSMGRPGSAISGDLIEERDRAVNILKSMLKAGKDSWVSRDEMEKWFDQILLLLRDIAVSKITQDENSLINSDLKGYLNKLGRSMELKIIIENYLKLSNLKKYFNFNLNKSLTWNYTGSMLRKAMDTVYV
jgi:DNA polymerase III subunit delta'